MARMRVLRFFGGNRVSLKVYHSLFFFFTLHTIPPLGFHCRSDTVVLMSSSAVPMPKGDGPRAAFSAALTAVCSALAEDVVRNGEGVQHLIRVRVSGAPTDALARAVGKSVVNSPLFKCAVNGNDPNVGRLVAAIGKCIGDHPDGVRAGKPLDLSRT